MDQYTSYAFISYSHKDMRIAKWLQRHLEEYRLPSELHCDIVGSSRFVRPVYRDQSDFSSGVLTREIIRHLEASKYLLVVCSPDSAQSPYVNEEVRAFAEMGRAERIIPILANGDYYPDGTMYPDWLRDYTATNKDVLLAINLSRGHRQEGLVKIVARLLGVSFDSLWQRHKRRLRTLRAYYLTGAFGIVLAMSAFAVPYALDLRIKPEAPGLPLPQACEIVVAGKRIPVSSVDTLVSASLPGYCRFRKVRVQLYTNYFQNIDTVFNPGIGKHDIMLHRDDTFGIVGGCIVDENRRPVSHATVSIGEIATETNEDGTFQLSIPVSLQTAEYDLHVQTQEGVIWDINDLIPSPDGVYILHH